MTLEQLHKGQNLVGLISLHTTLLNMVERVEEEYKHSGMKHIKCFIDKKSGQPIMLTEPEFKEVLRLVKGMRTAKVEELETQFDAL